MFHIIDNLCPCQKQGQKGRGYKSLLRGFVPEKARDVFVLKVGVLIPAEPQFNRNYGFIRPDEESINFILPCLLLPNYDE
jgi:hypothetical protein